MTDEPQNAYTCFLDAFARKPPDISTMRALLAKGQVELDDDIHTFDAHATNAFIRRIPRSVGYALLASGYPECVDLALEFGAKLESYQPIQKTTPFLECAQGRKVAAMMRMVEKGIRLCDSDDPHSQTMGGANQKWWLEYNNKCGRQLSHLLAQPDQGAGNLTLLNGLFQQFRSGIRDLFTPEIIDRHPAACLKLFQSMPSSWIERYLGMLELSIYANREELIDYTAIMRSLRKPAHTCMAANIAGQASAPHIPLQ